MRRGKGVLDSSGVKKGSGGENGRGMERCEIADDAVCGWLRIASKARPQYVFST